jgi:hypothetical protein
MLEHDHGVAGTSKVARSTQATEAGSDHNRVGSDGLVTRHR